jgi:hypothetical protein
MAPRAVTGASQEAALSPRVAVKCDLCGDRDVGPACVRACPVEAIARVEPLAAMADVREAVGVRVPRASLPRARRAWPWVLGAAVLSAAMARLPRGPGSGVASGSLAGAVVVLLVAYSVLKRSRLAHRPWVPSARASAVTHLVLGTLAVGFVMAHASGRAPAGVAGAALVAFLLASLTGAVTGAAYAVLPSMLARVERRARLSEDLEPRARELQDRTFAAMTGRGTASQALFAKMLAPYLESPVGGLALIASGRSLQGEEARLRARIDTLVQGRSASLDGLPELLRVAVERRALRAQWLLQRVLRACVPLHLVSIAIALVLIALHLVLVVRRP